jgi:hypothetical protein
LAEEINRYGGNARAVIYQDYGHQIPVEVRNIEIDPFIADIWEKKCELTVRYRNVNMNAMSLFMLLYRYSYGRGRVLWTKRHKMS